MQFGDNQKYPIKMIRNATKRLASSNFNGCRMLRNRLISSTSASTQKHKEAIVPFSMRDSFRYSAEEGYVRTSAFLDVAVQNLTIDQYLWKDLQKFEDKIAIVSNNDFVFVYGYHRN